MWQEDTWGGKEKKGRGEVRKEEENIRPQIKLRSAPREESEKQRMVLTVNTRRKSTQERLREEQRERWKTVLRGQAR